MTSWFTGFSDALYPYYDASIGITSYSIGSGEYHYTLYRDPRPERREKEKQSPVQNPLEFFGFDENHQGK